MPSDLYKQCPHCDEKNMAAAKFCISCEQPFDKKIAKAQKQPPAARAVVSKTVDPEEVLENEEVSIDPEALERDRAVAAGFVLEVEDSDRPRGISLEDAIAGQVKPVGGRQRRQATDKRNGKKILQEDGGNPKRR